MLIDPNDPTVRWLLLRTKPKQETTVVRALQGRDVLAYLPRVLEPRPHARAPHGPVPLFPSYVFAQCPVRDRFAAVNYCPGAIGVVRFGDLVAVVDDAFVAMLREREGERGFLVIAEARRQPRTGGRARIVKGPLEGFEGVVERYLPARDRVRLLLSLVRGTRRVEVEASHLKML